MSSESQGGSGKVTLFHQDAPEGLTYRIPALLYLPSESTFLVFAEKRSSFRDEHAEFLVMRRGKKDGMSVQWGPQESLVTAMLPNSRTMNPCPVFEKKSGTVFLFFICVETHVTEWHQITTGRNAARLGYVSSRDGGRTWSHTTDLTERVIGEDLENWATFAVGPGHGVQLSSGRLVIPAYTYYIHQRGSGPTPVCLTQPHCFTLYSDDGGQNWTRGQLLKTLRTTECQVAELTHRNDSQVLYCSARSPDRSRAEAFGMVCGDQFEESYLCKELCEPPHGCQGSIVSFNALPLPSDVSPKADEGEPIHPLGIHASSNPHKSTKSWLIFSHPTHGHKRLDLGIYLNMSPLDPGSWKGPWVLYKGPSGYSDLAVCEEEGGSLIFGCLFECGVTRECEEIAFQVFTGAELLGNLVQSGACTVSPTEPK
ncbi:sialidase-3-like [Sceloporus undulatus]|uniref:sialidase-3-like n=1 Tax=Sceloporus undulatus TaxID=8520 RepID=UPI001C4D380C|nr:sialidase-3-like [Sceloporus undulatus]